MKEVEKQMIKREKCLRKEERCVKRNRNRNGKIKREGEKEIERRREPFFFSMT